MPRLGEEGSWGLVPGPSAVPGPTGLKPWCDRQGTGHLVLVPPRRADSLSQGHTSLTSKSGSPGPCLKERWSSSYQPVIK